MIQSFLPLHPDFHRNYVQELPNIFSIWYNMYINKPMWLFCTVLSVKNMLPLLSHLAQKSSPWELPTSNYQALIASSFVLKSESESPSVVSDSLRPHGLYSPRNYSGQNTRAASPSFLQGIFPTQGLNPGFLHCRQILYQLATREAQEYWIGSLSLL